MVGKCNFFYWKKDRCKLIGWSGVANLIVEYVTNPSHWRCRWGLNEERERDYRRLRRTNSNGGTVEAASSQSYWIQLPPQAFFFLPICTFSPNSPHCFGGFMYSENRIQFAFGCEFSSLSVDEIIACRQRLDQMEGLQIEPLFSGTFFSQIFAFFDPWSCLESQCVIMRSVFWLVVLWSEGLKRTLIRFRSTLIVVVIRLT